MRYTVWSHGQLIGESDLGYARFLPKARHGNFTPSDAGASAMPVVTGVPAATMALSRAILDGAPNQGVRLEMTTQYADMIAAFDRREALQLELRDESGRVIETEWIDIRDIETLFQRAEEDLCADWESSVGYDLELEADIEHDMQLIDEWFAKADDNA